MEKNPFSISFGKKPYQYIERDLVIDEIIDEISSDIIQNQCFMLTGVRGSGKTVTMLKDENGLVKEVSGDGGKYILAYDQDKNLVSITDPLGNKTEYEYTDGKLTDRIEKNAENVTKTEFKNEYDGEGRIVKQTDGKGKSILYSYDTSEFWRIKVAITDRNGYNSSKVFDRFGELVSTTDPLGNTTYMTYDGNGNLASIKDPLGNTTIYTYDDSNNLLSVKDAEEKGLLKHLDS